MFARQTTDHAVEGVSLTVASESQYVFGAGVNDPVPIYGRGFFYNDAISVFSGLNLGYDYNLLIWYKATAFNDLFTVYNGETKVMGIS
jgi:hypothetical protein